MIRKNDIYSWLSILAMLPMVLTACLEEDNYKQCPNQTDKIQLTISLPEHDPPSAEPASLQTPVR